MRGEVLAGRGVVLSQNLGKTLNVRVGDKLRLQTPHGLQQTAVLALVPYFSTVIGTVGIDLDQMRAWFDRPERQHSRSPRPPAQIRSAYWPTSGAWYPHRTTYTTAAQR